MAFKESGSSEASDPSPALAGIYGLTYDWELLRFNQCPRCESDLVEFEHIDLLKCTCGFKITGALVRAMRITGFVALSRGFRIGNYDHETPF